jgi:hypothetical protein
MPPTWCLCSPCTSSSRVALLLPVPRGRTWPTYDALASRRQGVSSPVRTTVPGHRAGEARGRARARADVASAVSCRALSAQRRSHEHHERPAGGTPGGDSDARGPTPIRRPGCEPAGGTSGAPRLVELVARPEPAGDGRPLHSSSDQPRLPAGPSWQPTPTGAMSCAPPPTGTRSQSGWGASGMKRRSFPVDPVRSMSSTSVTLT